MIAHTLQPGEMKLYTWDDPSGRKVIKWAFPGVAKVTNCKPIDVNKVRSPVFVVVVVVVCLILHLQTH